MGYWPSGCASERHSAYSTKLLAPAYFPQSLRRIRQTIRWETSRLAQVVGKNYQSAADNPLKVQEILDKMVSHEWALKADTWDEVVKFLGSADITPNKLALLAKVRLDWSTKFRIIWDLLRSGVN